MRKSNLMIFCSFMMFVGVVIGVVAHDLHYTYMKLVGDIPTNSVRLPVDKNEEFNKDLTVHLILNNWGIRPLDADEKYVIQQYKQKSKM